MVNDPFMYGFLMTLGALCGTLIVMGLIMLCVLIRQIVIRYRQAIDPVYTLDANVRAHPWRFVWNALTQGWPWL